MLSAILAWATLCLGGVLAGTRAVTAVLASLLLAVHFLDGARGWRARPAGWLAVPFLLYAAANVLWVTPVPWLGWSDWLNWALAALVFWVVLNGVESRGPRVLLCSSIVAIGCASAALAAYQHFRDPHWIMLGRHQADQFIGRASGSFGIPNSLGVLMALLLPPVGFLALSRRASAAVRVLCAVALLFLLAGFVLAVSRGAWISLALALAVRPLLSPGRSVGWRLGAALGAAAAASAAAGVLYYSFPLMRTRMNQLVSESGERTRPIMWRGAWRIFESHPVLGAGAAAFDPLFEAYRPMGYKDQPYYAHCDYLNTLCDYGAVGFALALLAAWPVLWRGARSRGLAGAAFTGILAFSFHLLIDFHFKIPALAMILASVGALVAAGDAPALAPPPAGRRLAAGAFGLAAASGLLGWALPAYRAEAARYAARERIDRMASKGIDVTSRPEEMRQIREELRRAVRMDPGNAKAWSDIAYADSLEALVDPPSTARLGIEAEAEANRALAISKVVPEFWIRKSTALDMQGKWDDGGACLVEALKLAAYRPDVWYYQAYHLSLKPSETGPALAAANLSLRLDPGFLLAQTLRQRLGDRQ